MTISFVPYHFTSCLMLVLSTSNKPTLIGTSKRGKSILTFWGPVRPGHERDERDGRQEERGGQQVRGGQEGERGGQEDVRDGQEEVRGGQEEVRGGQDEVRGGH